MCVLVEYGAEHPMAMLEYGNNRDGILTNHIGFRQCGRKESVLQESTYPSVITFRCPVNPLKDCQTDSHIKECMLECFQNKCLPKLERESKISVMMGNLIEVFEEGEVVHVHYFTPAAKPTSCPMMTSPNPDSCWCREGRIRWRS